MKRTISVILVLVLAISLFAATNNQTVYSVNSPVYKQIEQLFISQGMAAPFASGPWTGDELLGYMAKIQRSKLSDGFANLYDEIMKELAPAANVDWDTVALDFGMDANLEGYAKLNGNLGEAYWIHGYKFRNPLIKFKMDTWATEHFYGYFELGLQDADLSDIYKENLTGNFNFLLTGMTTLDFASPKKALASVGGANWNFVAGRDKLSWGNGVTGNLLLSEDFTNHNFAKFTTFHNRFKYTLLGTMYPFYDIVYPYAGSETRTGQDDHNMNGYKSLIAHRLEFTFWKDKIDFALTEACMFTKRYDDSAEKDQGDPGFNLAMINPFGFMHNEYVRGTGNSILTFDLSFTPVKNLNLYAQFAVDDFALPGASDNVVPDANGFLVGVKSTVSAGKGFFKLSAEFAKTNKFLYLRGTYSGKPGRESSDSYGYGFDAIYRSFNNSRAIDLKNMFIGYPYGNDVNVIDFKAEYVRPEVITVGFEAKMVNSGVMGINSPWGEYYGELGERRDYADPFNVDSDVLAKDEVIERIISASLSADYSTPVKGLGVYGMADIVFVLNKDNKKSAPMSDVQATLGVRYSL